MKKYLFTLITALMCMFLFAICVSAETYTVSNDDEYMEAYEKSVDGDTIVVNATLTADIYANKSITYVLKADWESAKFVVDTSNVEVSFIADGGNFKIMPTNYSTTDGWMNIAEVYEKVVINLGGMNGGTLTIDGTNATHDRVSYVTMVEKIQYDIGVFPDICLNLLSGSAIANFNPTTKDDNVNACILYAKTINMYDGCQIYGNNVISAPLFKSCYFNMYGGEIFGNLLTSIRMSVTGAGFIYADRQFTMYGGRIYNNVLKTIDGPYQFNVVGFITTNQAYYQAKGAVILGGEIGDRYVFSTDGKNISGNAISAIFGVYVKDNGNTQFCYNTGITAGDRYIFTGEPQLTLDQETGKTVWKVSNATLESENNYGYSWNTTKKSGDKVAVFLNAQKKSIAGNNFDTYTLMNAYIDGVYSSSGSTTIAMPADNGLWSTSPSEYCHTGRAYTLSQVTSSTPIILYSAYNADRVTIDGTTICQDCKKPFSCNNPSHDLEIVSISYGNYTENGTKVLKCNTCGLEKAMETTAPALFICLGYSAPENGDGGISIRYTVNATAIEEYTKATGIELSYGLFATTKQAIGNSDIFDTNGNTLSGVVSAEVTNGNFAFLSLKMVGFDTEESKKAEFAIGAYVVTTQDAFVGRNWIMRQIGCFPTVKFIMDPLLVRNIASIIKKKRSVVMFPEAGYTFDGTSTVFQKSVAKLVKFLKVPLVTIISHGAHLRQPLFNKLRKRKLQVTCDYKYVLSKEEIANMSEDEIWDVIQKEFSFNEYNYQIENNIIIDEKNRADNLNSVLYKCPHCGSEGKMNGHDHLLECENCGIIYELCTNGELKCLNGETKYNTILWFYCSTV